MPLRWRLRSTRAVASASAARQRCANCWLLYFLAEVLVTNDSGPVHYCGIDSINVVALFGPETPAVFGPRTPRGEVFWAGIACSPCLSAFNNRWTACTNNVCMQRIKVEAVFNTVCRVYDHRSRREHG